MLQHCCRPSLLVRWFLLLLLPFCGFAWAIGFSAVRLMQSSSDKLQLPQHKSPNRPAASLSRINCSSSSLEAPSQKQPATLKMMRFRLRGWSFGYGEENNRKEQKRRSKYTEACKQFPYNPHNILAATPAGQKSFKRRQLHGCTDRDISISQSRETMAGGAPQFIVQIYNTCTMRECAPSKVHLNCGWFASKMVVNPGIFRRLAFDDCLVNAGRPIAQGQILRFTYQNSFMYPISFKSAKFC